MARQRNRHELSESVMADLDTMLRDRNPYALALIVLHAQRERRGGPAISVPRNTDTLHVERAAENMVAAAEADGKRDVGSDVHRQSTGPGPFPLATATSEPKRPTVLSRHKDGGRGRSRNIHGGGRRTRIINDANVIKRFNI
ncbi:hypothetical protein ACI65C_013768 [Semiaphis heraclei]